MTATNRWEEKGIVRKNFLLRAKMTLTSKSTVSTATAAVDDYYAFNCKQKGLPSFADAPTWTDVTDNPSEPTGYAYAGKSEQIETYELVTRTPLPVVYGDLVAHQSAGDVFSLVLTYDDPQEDKVYTVTVPSCTIVGVSIEAGENNGGSQTTIKIQPEGGKAANMPSVTETARS